MGVLKTFKPNMEWLGSSIQTGRLYPIDSSEASSTAIQTTNISYFDLSTMATNGTRMKLLTGTDTTLTPTYAIPENIIDIYSNDITATRNFSIESTAVTTTIRYQFTHTNNTEENQTICGIYAYTYKSSTRNYNRFYYMFDSPVTLEPGDTMPVDFTINISGTTSN